MCESCQGGVSFMGKAGSKQCVSNENTRCKELPFAALGYVCVVVLLRAGSRSQHCFPLPNLCTPMAASQRAAFHPGRVLTCLCYPSEGECSPSDSSKPDILWYQRNSGLAHLFPLCLIFLQLKHFHAV